MTTSPLAKTPAVFYFGRIGGINMRKNYKERSPDHKSRKERIKEISFYPFGISMKLSSSASLSTVEELFVLFSGCMVNLVFIATFKSPTIVYINTGIFIFNMLPIANLDGGRMLRLLLSAGFGEKTGNKVSVILSFALLLPLSALAFYTVIDSGQFSLFICCVYLAAIMIFKQDNLV